MALEFGVTEVLEDLNKITPEKIQETAIPFIVVFVVLYILVHDIGNAALLVMCSIFALLTVPEVERG